MTLSSALWRPTSSRAQRSSPSAVKRPVACRPPVTPNAGCCLAETIGQRRKHVRARSRATPRLAAPRPAPPRSRPSRTRRTTTRCRSAVAAARGRTRRASTSTVFAARSSGTRAATGVETLGEAEAERELLVVPRRPHRHRDRLAADPDLERLLDRDRLVARRACPGMRRARTPRVEYGGASAGRALHAASVVASARRPARALARRSASPSPPRATPRPSRPTSSRPPRPTAHPAAHKSVPARPSTRARCRRPSRAARTSPRREGRGRGQAETTRARAARSAPSRRSSRSARTQACGAPRARRPPRARAPRPWRGARASARPRYGCETTSKTRSRGAEISTSSGPSGRTRRPMPRSSVSEPRTSNAQSPTPSPPGHRDRPRADHATLTRCASLRLVTAFLVGYLLGTVPSADIGRPRRRRPPRRPSGERQQEPGRAERLRLLGRPRAARSWSQTSRRGSPPAPAGARSPAERRAPRRDRGRRRALLPGVERLPRRQGPRDELRPVPVHVPRVRAGRPRARRSASRASPACAGPASVDRGAVGGLASPERDLVASRGSRTRGGRRRPPPCRSRTRPRSPSSRRASCGRMCWAIPTSSSRRGDRHAARTRARCCRPRSAAGLGVEVVDVPVALDGEPFDVLTSSLDWFYERMRAGAKRRPPSPAPASSRRRTSAPPSAAPTASSRSISTPGLGHCRRRRARRRPHAASPSWWSTREP